MSLQAIKYQRGSLQLLDQRLLPHEFTYLDVKDPKTSWTHIKDMVVRGAPAIGVTGVLTIAMDLVANKGAGAAFTSAADALAYVNETADYLVTSRPTAVNLADGLVKVKDAAAAAACAAGATASSVVEAVIAAAEQYFDEDLTCNKAIGRYGAEAVLAAVANKRPTRSSGKVRVLTHCNTGSLATAGYGTALGIIRALHEQGMLEHAYCTETRPYNQGARLTAFELVHDGIPATLVCDSATCYLMASGEVDAVVVGADRVVANGDTANKIGTFMLSVVAAHNNVPFFIAAPTTTLDPAMSTGSEIEIEQRPSEELTHFRGTRVVTDNIGVWNPSFDVAPGRLIEGIVTQLGVIPKKGDTHQVREFMLKAGLLRPEALAQPPASPMSTPQGFYVLDTDKVKDYVAARPYLSKHVGAPDTKDTWKVREVGDGNINFVYILEGPNGGLALKQSLPFVRSVGDSWPLTQDRLRIEAEVLQIQAKYCPAHVPAVYRFDSSMAALSMFYIAPPAQIVRKGLMQGHIYPHFAEHMAEFLAQTLFNTSLLALPSDEFRKNVVRFNNPEMCALTEQVIFTEPYINAVNNRHTAPQLNADVTELRNDPAAKVAISHLKAKFMTSAEALIHGDLHTGSIMATDTHSYVIDPEFSYYGPMAFDVGKILANLLLAWFASYGQEQQHGTSRQPQREWLAKCVSDIWTQFSEKFLALWAAKGLSQGHLTPSQLLGHDVPQGSAALMSYKQAYMATLWQDTLGYMGAFIIRRLVGIAHVADMDCISDADLRASCERRALTFGRTLLTKSSQFSDIEALVAAAKDAATPRDQKFKEEYEI